MSPFHATPIPFTDEADWLEKRRQGLGASDVAAIFRLSKWQSPYSLWAEKRGELGPPEESDAMLVGKVIQPAILNLWEQRTGLHAVHRDVLWQHPEYPWALATPDALMAESFSVSSSRNEIGEAVLAPLEVKNEFQEWTEPPAQYRIQVCWQQGVLGLTDVPAQLVNLSARKKIQIFDVEWDPDLWAALLQGAKDFWHLVAAGTPPPVDDSEATTEALAALFPPESAGGVVDLDELTDEINALRLTKERVKDQKAVIAQFENEIKAAMGDADVGLIDGEEAVTWRTQHRGAFAVGETSFRVLRLKGVKE